MSESHKGLRLVNIQCKACEHIYSLRDPYFINGIPHIGTKVSTEVGCPKCLDPDGVIVNIRRFQTLVHNKVNCTVR